MSRLGFYLVGDSQVAAKFERASAEVADAMKGGVLRGTLRVMRKAKENTNGPVLGVRTGRLRRSINQRVTEEGGQVVGIVGTNVRYAKLHEYGFTGTQTVREHMRKLKAGRYGLVRAHARHMVLPERSFLRSALAELQPDIARDIQNAVAAKLRLR